MCLWVCLRVRRVDGVVGGVGGGGQGGGGLCEGYQIYRGMQFGRWFAGEGQVGELWARRCEARHRMESLTKDP